MSKSIYISFLSQPFLDSITGLSVGVPALYERKRNKIEVTNSFDISTYEKINKIRAVKSFFDKTEFTIIETLDNSTIFLGDNWYIIYNEGNIINSCVLDFDNKAKNEFEATIQVLFQYNNQQQLDIEKDYNYRVQKIIQKF